MPSSRRTRTVETCDESGKERGGEGLSRFTRDPLSKKSNRVIDEKMREERKGRSSN
jgi:hypothetical protein